MKKEPTRTGKRYWQEKREQEKEKRNSEKARENSNYSSSERKAYAKKQRKDLDYLFCHYC